MNKFIILALFALAVGALADYAKPAHHGYGHAHGHGHAAPVVHHYPVHAPHAKCGANLLVGCAPSVAHAPCYPVHEHKYEHHGYGHAHGGHHGYRAPEADAFDQFEE